MNRSLLPSAVKLFLAVATFASLRPIPASAVDEGCASCGRKVVFSGDFQHSGGGGRGGFGGGGRGARGGAPGGARGAAPGGAPGGGTAILPIAIPDGAGPGGARGARGGRGGFAAPPIEGAPAGTEQFFRQNIYGRDFTATISGIPEGRYDVIVGEMENANEVTNKGERVFDINVGDHSLARNFDIIAAVGAPNRVCFLTNTIDHRGGSLAVNFHGNTGAAKMCTLEVKDPATGTSLLVVRASELVEIADLPAYQIPQVSGPVLWLDPTQPRAVRIRDLMSRMTLAEKTRQMGNGAPAIHRPGLDLPAYDYWSEALHGVANTQGVTVFPQAIANGATFDTDLVNHMGHFIGIEGRAKNNFNRANNDGNSQRFGGLNFWSPNINLFRDPRWGRGQETYGEDDFLLGRMGVAFIKGLQGDDPKYTLALACAKHFAVHSGPEALRHVIDVYPSERDLYENYLPHFEAAVREGHVGAIMSAYNAVDGEPAPSSTLLLQLNLRERWGFDGQVVSDCDAVGDIWRNHHTVATAAEAAARAVKFGTDLCCGSTYDSLVLAYRSNLITSAEMDVALYRILESRFKLGLFDPTNLNPFLQIGTDQLDTAEHRQVALQLARESMVLLKNDGLLPLNRSKVKTIAVFGENATDRRMLYGNYNGTPSRDTTILEGIQQIAGSGIKVTYAQGCPLVVRGTNAAGRGGGGGFGGRGGFGGAAAAPQRPLAELRAEALSNAANADILIYVGGINSQLEGEEGNARAAGGLVGFTNGDRTRIELPQVQEDFVQALYRTGKPVIMVNCSGSAMAVPWEADHLPAILQAWYPGEEGGRAVAETLFGDNNPSGRLPITFYRTTAELPVFTNYSMANRTYRYFTGKPLYAFGHGLSYTKFDYSKPAVAAQSVKANGTITVTFDVQNTGKVDGDEVAQVYFAHVKSAVPQPIKALVGFKRVHVAAGKSQTVSVDIPAERLRYWDVAKNEYTVEAGGYRLMVGAASDDIRGTVEFSVIR